MRSALVTGTAGFIGSSLARNLLSEGIEVIGIDNLSDSYDVALKQQNLSALVGQPGFRFEQVDLLDIDLLPLVQASDVVFHLAAMPGVRSSWSTGFERYVENNVLGLQRLLEALRESPGTRMVWASSSSVYGNTDGSPSREDSALHPYSPYGVTKAAGEHLCSAYVENFGLEIVALRYFTVYGPGQRPDMGLHRLCEAALGRYDFHLFGDGEQVRDMTFVDDVVDATRSAARVTGLDGEFLVVNIAGGTKVTLNELIAELEDMAETSIPLIREPQQAGDVRTTAADASRARERLGWAPRRTLTQGLAAQLEWHRQRT